MRVAFAIIALASLLSTVSAADAPFVPSDPFPTQEPVSSRFTVTAGQVSVPVYSARVCSLSVEERQHLGLPVTSGTYQTTFASFDVAKPTEVTVTCPDAITGAKILPTTSGVTPVVSGQHVTFNVSKPQQLTLEVNGDWLHSLHLFVDPPEENVPLPGDPDVIYFGPGIHEIGTTVVKSGQTVYLAPGAFVYGKPELGPAGPAIFSLKGDTITIRGRGVIDGSQCPRGTLSLLGIYGTNVHVEGVILRDSSGFSLPVRRAAHVTIDNVKIFGWRGNSDGIDICNSHNVEVTNSFLRTFDDLIVLKTDKGQGDEADIRVSHCVLWNEFAHALSIGAEIREPIDKVSFADCDIIHDMGREWLLRIFNCDSGAVTNVTFDNIRTEEARRLMSVWIGQAVWSRESERGHIDHVLFHAITLPAPQRPAPLADLVGFDADHAVHDVQFQNVSVAGQPLKLSDVQQNAFVGGVQVTP